MNFLYSLFLIIFFGDLSKSKNIITIKSTLFKINSVMPVPIQCDGEKFEKFPLVVQSKNQFISLLTL